MPLDRNRFVKVLLLTQSDNDGEALAAIRAANRMLSEAGVGWGGLISGSHVKTSHKADAPPWVEPEPEVSLREAFELLEGRGELVDEVKAWYGWWIKFGKLEPSKVRRVYELLKETGDADR